MDFLNKEIVKSFYWTDYSSDRETTKSERINGRLYVKIGTKTATTIVGDLYKDTNPSNGQANRYTLLIGLSRQHPCDVKCEKEEGIEKAHVAALIEPIAKIELFEKIDFYQFKDIATAYVATLPIEFVKTKQEIINAYGKEAYKHFKH